MDTIRNYLESLFIGVPQTTATRKLKADLLANMEDHYQELLEDGRNEHEAIGVVIASFGSIDELLEGLEIPKELHHSAEIDILDQEAAEVYWQRYQKAALYISLGVLMGFAAIVSSIFFAQMTYSPAPGMLSFFFCSACAICLFIMAGMNLSQLKRLLSGKVLLSATVQSARKREESYQRSFTFSLLLGIGLMVTSFGPLFFGSLGFCLAFAMFGAGIFFILYSSMVRHSYRRLAR